MLYAPPFIIQNYFFNCKIMKKFWKYFSPSSGFPWCGQGRLFYRIWLLFDCFIVCLYSHTKSLSRFLRKVWQFHSFQLHLNICIAGPVNKCFWFGNNCASLFFIYAVNQPPECGSGRALELIFSTEISPQLCNEIPSIPIPGTIITNIKARIITRCLFFFFSCLTHRVFY